MEMIQTAVLIAGIVVGGCEADPRTTFKRDRGACSLLVPPPARGLAGPAVARERPTLADAISPVEV